MEHRGREFFVRRTQWLTQGLVLSGVLNVGLLIVCFYYAVQKNTIDPTGSLGKQVVEDVLEVSLADKIASYRRLPLADLLTMLTSRQEVELGLEERDLSLAILTTDHHFDLGRALGGELMTPAQYEGLSFYPGLSEEHFEVLAAFTQAEAWPLTGRGLFELLREQGGDAEIELAVAFTHTLEFLAVETLFSHGDLPYEKAELIEIVTAGPWERLAALAEEQGRASVRTDAQRRRFLLSYVELGSATAAELFVRTDREYLTDALADDQLAKVIQTMDRPTPEVGFLLVDLLLSPRSPDLWEAAATKLYHFADEPMPAPYDHLATLARFVPSEVLSDQPAPLPIAVQSSAITTHIVDHVVQQGDSLWAIARRYHLTVPELKEANDLTTNAIRPGQHLTIPQHHLASAS